MIPVWNLLHHIVGNLFYFGTTVCLFLAVTTTMGAIFLLVGKACSCRATGGRRRARVAIGGPALYPREGIPRADGSQALRGEEKRWGSLFTG